MFMPYSSQIAGTDGLCCEGDRTPISDVRQSFAFCRASGNETFPATTTVANTAAALREPFVARMAQPERPQHAPHPVPQVGPQQQHGGDVDERPRKQAEARDHFVVYIALLEARVHRAERQVEQVVDDEGEEEERAPAHGARRVGGLARPPLAAPPPEGRSSCRSSSR